MDNVIIFPKGKKGTPPQSMSELVAEVVGTRMAQIQFFTEEVIDMIMYRAAEEGFNMYDDGCAELNALLTESIKAAMLYTIDVEHPLLDVAKEIFIVEEPSLTEENVDDHS